MPDYSPEIEAAMERATQEMQRRLVEKKSKGTLTLEDVQKEQQWLAEEFRKIHKDPSYRVQIQHNPNEGWHTLPKTFTLYTDADEAGQAYVQSYMRRMDEDERNMRSTLSKIGPDVARQVLANFRKDQPRYKVVPVEEA